MDLELSRNFYSPKLLAKELALFMSESFIRKQVQAGALKAYRLGAKKILIMRKDIEEWVKKLPSASEPTNYNKKRKGRAAMSARELGIRSVASRAAQESAAREERCEDRLVNPFIRQSNNGSPAPH